MKYPNTKHLYSTLKYDESLRKNMLKIYSYMSAALMLSGLIAILTVYYESLLIKMYVVTNNEIIGFSTFGWLVVIAPVGIALTFSFRLFKMSILTAQVLFWGYAILLGLSLSSFFFLYTAESIGSIFLITASMFGFMSIYGYTTQADLTSLGSFLIMGLIGIMIASVVNLFFLSSGFYFILSVISIFIFTGLTAFDVQRIKNMHMHEYENSELATKIVIISALTLYLDFINIFVHLLRLFGSKKRKTTS